MVGRTDSARSRSRGFSKSDSQVSNDSPVERVGGRGFAHSKCNIYICPVPWDYTKAKLVNIFRKFGETTDSMILTKTRFRRRNPDGCVGFVDFKHNSSARRAIKRYNGAKMRTVFRGSRGETRLVVRFADARNKRPIKRRPERVRRRAIGDWQRTRNKRRGRNRFSSRSRSRSRKRIKRERSKSSSSKKVKDESPSASDQRRSRSPRSRDRSLSSNRSRSRSRERYKFSSDESIEASESEAPKRSQHGSSGERNPPADPPEKKGGEKIIVSCNKDARSRSVAINPSSKSNPSTRASRSNSVDADCSSKLLPVSAGEDRSSLIDTKKEKSPNNVNQKSSRHDHAHSDPAPSDNQLRKHIAQASIAGESKPRETVEEPKSPEKSFPVRSPSTISAGESAEEGQSISSTNEKEWESFRKFKKMRIRVRWQAYQQYQEQVKLLETKNLELEEDLLQLEDQCRYWKDKFKRTLKEYRESKDHLRKARRYTFEEEATIV